MASENNQSTDLAALELIDRILISLDKMETPFSIFIDLSKAFDTLNHSILLHKLHYYGFTGSAHDLIESYLSNRTQYVDINGTVSDSLMINTGVPQGSILGPLLFLIYMNDIANSSLLFNFLLYADDTTLSNSLEIVISEHASYASILTKINRELTSVSTWLKANKLSINVDKSKYMIFHAPQKKVPILQIQIDGKDVERVFEFNFLGLTINENLNWKSHTNKIASKISKNIGILNKLKHFLPIDTKRLVYNSLILSHLNFGILAWGFDCGRIEKLQKKAVRIITLNKYNAHTDPLFKQLKLLKVKDILFLQEMKFYYKYLHNDLPEYLLKIPFVLNRNIHSHDTRARNELYATKPIHEYAKKCLRHDIPKVINKAPSMYKDKFTTHSIEGFSWYIKLKTIEAYTVTCTIQNCYICSRN